MQESSSASEPIDFYERLELQKQLGDKSFYVKDLTTRIFLSSFEQGECTSLVDTDGDRLPDCVETGDGVFVSELRTGTDPLNPDTDGDNITDGDEALGTLDGLDLPALGANPLVRNIFIEYDWVEDEIPINGCIEPGQHHSHRPQAEWLDAVTEFFLSAPVTNPDGSTGIHVIHDYGQGGAFTGGNNIGPDLAQTFYYSTPEYEQLRADHFARNRIGYFYYAVIVHDYGPDRSFGGFAHILSDSFTIATRCGYNHIDPTFTLRVTQVLVHELGHAMGLHHGGDTRCEYKFNYHSMMSYRYLSVYDPECTQQTVPHTRLFLSSGDRLSLDEAELDETVGMCGVPVDWNKNGIIETNVTADLLSPTVFTNCHPSGEPYQVYHDFDDWKYLSWVGLTRARIRYGIGKYAQMKDPIPDELIVCPTVDTTSSVRYSTHQH